MATLGDVGRFLARLEQRVEALTPQPETRFELWISEGLEVCCPSTGERLSREDFDRTHAGARTLTFNFTRWDADWSDGAAPDRDEEAGADTTGIPDAGWPCAGSLATYQCAADERGR